MKYRLSKNNKRQISTFSALAPVVGTSQKMQLVKQLEHSSPLSHKTVVWTLSLVNCYREEPNLTSC